MTASEIAVALDEARLRYHQEAEKLAAAARRLMLPHFRRERLTFKAGNGTWYIENTDGEDVRDHELPAYIRDLLYLDIDRGQCLGYWVADIKPPRPRRPSTSHRGRASHQ